MKRKNAWKNNNKIFKAHENDITKTLTKKLENLNVIHYRNRLRELLLLFANDFHLSPPRLFPHATCRETTVF